MLPSVALALGLIFYLWLIRQDMTLRGKISVGLWIPFLWLLIKSSRPVTAWLGIGGGNQIDGNPIEAAIAFVLFFGAFVVLQRRRFPWTTMATLNGTFFLLIVYFGISALWSPYPFVTFKRWFKEFGNILIALVVLTEASPPAALKALCVRCAYLLFPLSIVLIKYFPAWGRAYTVGGFPMITGVTQQKNSLGLICCVFGLALVWDIIDTWERQAPGGRRWRSVLPQLLTIAIGLWLLALSQSKTSLLAFAAGAAILFSTRLGPIARAPRAFAATCMIVIPVLLLIAALKTLTIAPLLEAVGRDATFTERTNIWNAVLAQDINPIIGCGFYSFWLEHAAAVAALGVPQIEAHNGYLETYLDGGIIGCILLGLFLFATCSRLARSFSPTSTWSRALFAFAIMGLITNFAETYFFRLDTIWFVFVVSALALPILQQVDESQELAARSAWVSSG